MMLFATVMILLGNLAPLESSAETLTAVKVSPNGGPNSYSINQDGAGLAVTLSSASGFDPNLNAFGLSIKITRYDYRQGSSLVGTADDSVGFDVVDGIVYHNAVPQSEFYADRFALGRLSDSADMDVYDYQGDGLVYQGTNIVGTVSGVNARIQYVGVVGAGTPVSFKRLWIPLVVTVDPSKLCKSCAAGDCAPGGTSAELGSIDFTISLGRELYGDAAPSLRIKRDLPDLALTKPASLMVTRTKATQAIYDANGAPRQILSSQALADIVVSNAYKYVINLYPSSQAGTINGSGFYAPTNFPFKTITVENPDAVATTYNRLFITEVTGSLTNTANYTYDTANSQWIMETFNGLRREILSRAWNTGNTERTEVKTVTEPGTNGAVRYKEQNRYHVFPWGEERIEQIIDPDGAHLTSTWDFYTDSAQTGYRLLKQSVAFSGFWERFDYDSQGRVTKKYSSFLNAGVGAATNQCRVVTTTYSSSNPRETIVETLLGQEVARTYLAFYTDVIQTIQCQTPGALWTATDNLTSGIL